MRAFFTMRRLMMLGIILIIVLVGIFAYQIFRSAPPVLVTETVSRGDVVQIVSVSGIVEAKNTAELAFPVSGIVADILVKEGDVVVAEQILATLEQSELEAEELEAEGALRIAVANRDEILTGPRDEARDVTSVTVDIAKDNLARTILEETEKVASAKRTLLSEGLEAFPVDTRNSDTPMTVSGTYTCTAEGTYTLSVFRSGAQSGHSYRLSGLETGTYSAYTTTPAPLGTCGLMVQFNENETYSTDDWVIEIPNTRSVSYNTNINSYLLAKQQMENNVSAAKQALLKAEREQILENATPRAEELERANATVAQAGARLLGIYGRINDRILHAPFDGVISNIDTIKGETVTNLPVITMVANNTFALKVRIPEIDITKVRMGQKAEVVFDARRNETLDTSITFIAPLATMIDGVAYFEATLELAEYPEWLRGGLNADINIMVGSKVNTLRIPKRFLIEENGTYAVLIPNGEVTTKKTVERGFVGNDGFVEIIGLNEGDTVVAP